MNEWIKQRLEENKKLFSSSEWTIIQYNFGLAKKIYCIAFKNILDIMKKN